MFLTLFSLGGAVYPTAAFKSSLVVFVLAPRASKIQVSLQNQFYQCHSPATCWMYGGVKCFLAERV